MSTSEEIPVGLLEPVSWRNSRWTMAIAMMINGRIKWKAKNRVRVALSTENPPQIHSTKFVPMYGIADKRMYVAFGDNDKIISQINNKDFSFEHQYLCNSDVFFYFDETMAIENRSFQECFNQRAPI